MSTQSTTTPSEVALCSKDEIIWELLFNYLLVSFPDARIDTATVKDILEKTAFDELVTILKEQNLSSIEEKGRVRNIFVIGAGAAHNVYKDIPLGNTTINSLEEEFLDKPEDEDVSVYVEGEIKKLINKTDLTSGKALLYHLLSYQSARKKLESRFNNKLSFEEHLTLFSSVISPEAVRRILKKKVNFRYLPSLLFEIIAHLFKHRFIDAIINFNFDELLDQAILEELSSSEYKRVISDGDCSGIEELIVENRFKIPVYIKPHGTVGHENTMRFTKDHYIDIPEGVEKLLAQLVGGYIRKDDKDDIQRVDRVNIFCLGFAMESIEFNYILKKNMPLCNKAFIYYFSEEGKVRYEKFNDKDISANKIQERNFKISYDTGSFNELLKGLFANIRTKLDTPFKPRSTFRHELIHELFYNLKEGVRYYESSDYYLNRFIVEVVITLLNNGGFIEPYQLKEERTSLYYELYRESKQAENGKDQQTFTIYDIIYDLFDLQEEFSFAGHLFNVPKVDIGNITDYLIDKIKKSESYIGKSIIPLKNKIDNPKVKSYFQLMELKYIYELAPRFKDQARTIFGAFEANSVIHTNLSFVYHSWEMFTSRSNEWNTILLTTEKAKLIGTILKRLKELSTINKDDDRYQCLIDKKIIFKIVMRYESVEMSDTQLNKLPGNLDADSSEYVIYADIKNILEHDLNAKIHYVPYWSQNDHFIMFLNHTDVETTFVRSIFFEKEGYSRKINPVSFGKDCKEDHKMLFQYFVQYWLKGSPDLATFKRDVYEMKTYKNKKSLIAAAKDAKSMDDKELNEIAHAIFKKDDIDEMVNNQ